MIQLFKIEMYHNVNKLINNNGGIVTGTTEAMPMSNITHTQ